MRAPVIIYNENLKPVAVLKNAFDVGYEQRYNELWQAWFSLPVNDPKAIECIAFRYAEFWEGNERVDLFRILPTGIKKSEDGATISYQCEHVLGTLIDDVMFQYHQTDNITPVDTINYILNKQTTKLWVLGAIDFIDLYSYKWENENLLAALFSVPTAYSGEYMWTWDTSSIPWKINLIRPSNSVSARILYRKNLIDIGKEEDPTGIITRIYALGYGEGINQLTIKEVNNGIPYLDSDTITTYGVKSYIHVDQKEEDAKTLKAKALAILEANKRPRISYSVTAADLWQITEDSLDKFVTGGLVHVNDTETGIEFDARVKVRRKNNYTEDIGNVGLEIGNAVLSMEDFNTSISSRQRVSETYSQGATNIDSNDYEDNCDSTHPAVIKFYIPKECVRINKCLLSYQTGKFRAYETGAAIGGSLTSGASSKSTSDSGGSATGLSTTGTAIWNIGQSAGSEMVYFNDNHNHGITDGLILQVYPTGSVQFTASGKHTHSLNTHYHKFDLPNHNHGMEHAHQIASHTHDITYGIYEYQKLPTALTIKIDGNIIPNVDLNGNDIDLVKYLSTDSSGKIKRGCFHTVEITPDNLARITATVIKQIFLQSRGGGDY